jgi:hypothetical protein
MSGWAVLIAVQKDPFMQVGLSIMVVYIDFVVIPFMAFPALLIPAVLILGTVQWCLIGWFFGYLVKRAIKSNIDDVARYAAEHNLPNQSTDPTLASGTPGAGHQPRHP